MRAPRPFPFLDNVRCPPATLACLSLRGAGKSDTYWLSDNDDRTKPRAFPQEASPSQVTVVESIRHTVSRWRFLPTASRRVQPFDNQPSVLSTTLSFIPPHWLCFLSSSLDPGGPSKRPSLTGAFFFALPPCSFDFDTSPLRRRYGHLLHPGRASPRDPCSSDTERAGPWRKQQVPDASRKDPRAREAAGSGGQAGCQDDF